MSFLEILERARAFLERNGRVSVRALQLEFELNDVQCEALVEELVDVQRVAALEGQVLSWLGSGPAAQEPTDATEPGTGVDRRAGAPAEAERRQLTVMFCDLVGSTELSQRLDAEELREVVRAYQEAATGAVERYEGHVAQYLGDGLLVYFGYPRAHEDDAERALRAGREVVRALGKLNERLEPEHGVRLAARVGVHTGPVVVGAVGGGSRSETLALGDTTNIAARLEGVAEPGSVVASGATLQLVPGMFATRELGTPPLKGISEPVPAYAVLQPTGVRSLLDASAGHLTPFVGRQTELGVLADAWEHAVEGSGRAVLVQGEAGLGKSRLCYELKARLAGEAHTWLECRCSPFTTATAFRPIVELVEQALDFRPDETPAGKLRKLAAGLSLGDFEADEVVPLLAEWLELPEEAGYTRLAWSPDAKRRRILETLAAWNLRLSELQPLVALVEDLHWCDPSSLELLGLLVGQSATARVLVIGTARSEFESPWPARSNLQQLTLGRLTQGQAREMVAALSAAQGLPETVVEQLVARADGVPLYAEELTRSVVAVGDKASAESIPVTLRDSLLARLDRLSSVKEVAQRASVLGREFSYPLLAATAGLDEAVLREGLSRLVEAELLFVRGEPPRADYSFKHALVQEAAYDSLLRRTRQQLHGCVADALEVDFPERAAAEPELLARHAELAGRVEGALAGYQRAAEQSRARSAYEEAIRHLQRAIELLTAQPGSRERDAREAALQMMLGGALTGGRGYTDPEVERAFERMRALCEATGDAAGLGWSLLGLATYANNVGQPVHGQALGSRSLAIALDIGDDDLTLRAHLDLGFSEFWRGQLVAALAHFESALTRSGPARETPLLLTGSITDHDVPVLSMQAWTLWLLGFPERALARIREAVCLARTIDHPYSLAYALVNAAITHRLRRDPAAQLEVATEAVEFCEAQGFPFWLGLARLYRVEAQVADGAPEGLAELRSIVAEQAGGGVRSGVGAIVGLVGEAHLAAGQLSEARSALEAGLGLCTQLGETVFEPELRRVLGEVVVAEGGTASDAEAHFRSALELARSQAARAFELRAATSLAHLCRSDGRSAEALDLLQPVYAWFTEGFDTPDLREAKALLDAGVD